jgi:hypothetical protein
MANDNVLAPCFLDLSEREVNDTGTIDIEGGRDVLPANDMGGVKGFFPRGKEFAQAVLAPSGNSSSCMTADIERVGLGEGVNENNKHGASNRRARRADGRAGGKIGDAIDDVVKMDAPQPRLVIVSMPGFESQKMVVNCVTRNEAHTRGCKSAKKLIAGRAACERWDVFCITEGVETRNNGTVL